MDADVERRMVAQPGRLVLEIHRVCEDPVAVTTPSLAARSMPALTQRK